jgi:hypothetical protein
MVGVKKESTFRAESDVRQSAAFAFKKSTKQAGAAAVGCCARI